jgi:hypothetical protein
MAVITVELQALGADNGRRISMEFPLRHRQAGF